MALRNLYLFGHPRVTWVFSKLRGLQYYFPENFSSNLKFSESDSFSDSFLHCIFDSENFRFPFSTKNNLTWRVKWEKWNFRKSYGISYTSFENCVHEWNGRQESFSLPQAIENCRHFCFSEQIFHRKQSLGAPDWTHSFIVTDFNLQQGKYSYVVITLSCPFALSFRFILCSK